MFYFKLYCFVSALQKMTIHVAAILWALFQQGASNLPEKKTITMCYLLYHKTYSTTTTDRQINLTFFFFYEIARSVLRLSVLKWVYTVESSGSYIKLDDTIEYYAALHWWRRALSHLPSGERNGQFASRVMKHIPVLFRFNSRIWLQMKRKSNIFEPLMDVCPHSYMTGSKKKMCRA